MKILIVGDLHGDWGKLNQLLTKKNPDIVFQCGDFGWWPKMEVIKPVLYGRQNTWILDGIKRHGSQIFWCDGNHEEHLLLKQDGKIHKMYQGVNHCSRGSIVTLPDGRVVMFAGGADSIDKNQRMLGHDWWPEENITNGQLDIMLSHDRVDIVISHTCPVSFKIKGSEGKSIDPNRHALERVMEKHKPSLWYFGHWHYHMEGKVGDTRWICLDYPKHGGRWWTWLP
jgi:Icc-related predicted phosphoesterase